MADEQLCVNGIQYRQHVLGFRFHCVVALVAAHAPAPPVDRYDREPVAQEPQDQQPICAG